MKISIDRNITKNNRLKLKQKLSIEIISMMHVMFFDIEIFKIAYLFEKKYDKKYNRRKFEENTDDE